MSTPRSLVLAAAVRRESVSTRRLAHAALVIDPSTGPARATAVLVPGFTGSKEDFASVLSVLADGGYRVIAVDQRGQYETGDGADALDPSAILDVLADDLTALIDAVSPDEPVHLVGHSLGGLVARAGTIRAAHRVATLTLMCSGPGAIPEGQWPMLQALVAALPDVPLEQVWAAKESMDRAQGVEPPAASIGAFLHGRFVANSPQALAAKAHLLMTEPDRSGELATVARAASIPVLVLHGDSDDAWPLEAQARMAVELDAPVVVIAAAGHSPAVDQPDATAAALLEFWTGRQV